MKTTKIDINQLKLINQQFFQSLNNSGWGGFGNNNSSFGRGGGWGGNHNNNSNKAFFNNSVVDRQVAIEHVEKSRKNIQSSFTHHAFHFYSMSDITFEEAKKAKYGLLNALFDNRKEGHNQYGFGFSGFYYWMGTEHENTRLSMLKKLLEEGADPNICPYDPFIDAVHLKDRKDKLEINIKILKLLMERRKPTREALIRCFNFINSKKVFQWLINNTDINIWNDLDFDRRRITTVVPRGAKSL
eukprot:UN24425